MRIGSHAQSSFSSFFSAANSWQRSMLFSRLSIRAGEISQAFSPSASGKQSTTCLFAKSSENFFAVSTDLKFTKAKPRLHGPSLCASGFSGRNTKSKSEPYFLFSKSKNCSRVYFRGTPRNMSKVSLLALGSREASIEGGAGVATDGKEVGAGKYGGGFMKPVGVLGGMYGGVAVFLLLRLFSPDTPANALENGISLPASSRNRGCQSGLSNSFSMNFSSRRFSMFCSRPCTRAKETSATFALPKPGRHCLVLAP
mmetsp:Transcript_48079/g.97884  ORF Transcript_48079/g.97884 Transcript_48079/m.97884 type:complete len:255 (+) Transcript_48079:844-1608(+)